MNASHKKSIEDRARDLPVPELPEELWDRIETHLEQPESSPHGHSGAPWYRYAVAATFVAAALIAAWMMMQDFNPADTTTTQTSPLIESANDDLDMAITYYERAIGKLEKAANNADSGLNPDILALYTEKISLLQQSIAECKQALNVNRNSPVVRAQLFASYADLQSTYETLSKSTYEQSYGN